MDYSLRFSSTSLKPMYLPRISFKSFIAVEITGLLLPQLGAPVINYLYMTLYGTLDTSTVNVISNYFILLWSKCLIAKRRKEVKTVEYLSLLMPPKLVMKQSIKLNQAAMRSHFIKCFEEPLNNLEEPLLVPSAQLILRPQKLHDTQLQINWGHFFLLGKLIAYLISILLLKLLS